MIEMSLAQPDNGASKTTPNASGKRVSINGKRLITSGSTVLLYCNTSLRVSRSNHFPICLRIKRLSAMYRRTIGAFNSLSYIERMKEDRSFVFSYHFSRQHLRLQLYDDAHR